MDDDVFNYLVGLAVQGERLRVSNRLREDIPLNEHDSQIAACGVGTIGEHVESGRIRLLRIVRKLYPNHQEKFLEEVWQTLINEGSDKP